MSISEEHRKELKRFVKERNEALFSFDEKKIKAYLKKYDIPIPDNEDVFWGAVAKAVCHITGAPVEAVVRAKMILDVLHMSTDIK